MSEESEVNVILAHLSYLKEKVDTLNTQMEGVKDEIVCLKLQVKDTYIPRQTCVEIQKKCHAKMDRSATKDELLPLKRIMYGILLLIMAAVVKVTFQGATFG